MPSIQRQSKPYSLLVMTCVSLLLSGCSAEAQEPRSSPIIWPQPKQTRAEKVAADIATDDVQWLPLRIQPHFQAPGAVHCARPVVTREMPGRTNLSQPHKPSFRDFPSISGDTLPSLAPSSEKTATLAADSRGDIPPESAPPSLASPKPSSMAYPSRAGDAAIVVGTGSMPKQEESPRSHDTTVTAGVVDDNADFSEYLAFLKRTQVHHLDRDVSERYLLQVRDKDGRAVPDAEVAVRSPGGYAMWARTDTAGRVWIHPNAFDPERDAIYEVLVRKEGQQAGAFLRRGQKNAVDVALVPGDVSGRARLDLVFLIDATGSMGDEIDKLKRSLHSIAADVARLPSRPDLCFGMVAYRDKGDEFIWRSHDFTDDLNAFQKVLNQLNASSGGDYPEAMNEALYQAVHNLNWRGDNTARMVVLLADAPPHLDYDGPKYDEEMMAALGKGIKIFSVGASGLDKQGEYIQRQIAQYTGGRFVFLTYADASDPGSGAGHQTSHDVKNYSVETLDRLIVRLVREELDGLPRS